MVEFWSKYGDYIDVLSNWIYPRIHRAAKKESLK